MKNEDMVIEILSKNGFSFNKENNFWELDDWKIQIYKDYIEFYEDVEGGRYYIGVKDLIDIQSVIDSM